MSRQSTSLVTTTRSTQMLRLTTSTPGIRWLHHRTFRSEKQVRACCRFITRKRESLFQRARSIFSKYGKPVHWMSQKRKSNQELDNCQFKIILERKKKNNCSQKQNPRSWDMNTERILPKKTCELKRQIDSQAMEIWHTRKGYEQYRREQALLHEELADRERSIEKFGRIEERAWVSTRRIFDKKVGRKSF